ncbi:hypothetical protein DFH28DRAFT_881771 [Melampsora americana]|nr:hypothetical protein DFH28DRAFT_901477 [Melampsora americana]KAH9822485.1 hypothetical protein DFH28DRAFT_881771 [Melampsora americana]
MSTSFQSTVFLPDYILECVVDQSTPKIDTELFLSKASANNLIEMIVAFYPHLNFTSTAKEDRELLRKIFIEMVAPRLSNVIIPLQHTTKYIEASLMTPTWGPQGSSRTINSSADINHTRTEVFNLDALTYLKIGQYRLAAKNLNKFTETYKFLNVGEVNELWGAENDAEDALHEIGCNLKECHRKIESTQLLLRSELSASERKELEEKLKCAILDLNSHRRTFTNAIQNTAFISALASHHQ